MSAIIVARAGAPPHKKAMSLRRIAFYLGWLLLLAAFAAGAGGAVVHTNPTHDGGMVSAHDLWYTLFPGNLVVTQIRVERLSPELWSAVIRPLLNLPAWFLTGVPGTLLAWFCRPVRVLTPDEEKDMRETEDAMFLYDALAEQAEAEGYGEGDDRAPTHEEQHFLDGSGITAADSTADFDITLPDKNPPPDGRR